MKNFKNVANTVNSCVTYFAPCRAAKVLALIAKEQGNTTIFGQFMAAYASECSHLCAEWKWSVNDLGQALWAGTLPALKRTIIEMDAETGETVTTERVCQARLDEKGRPCYTLGQYMRQFIADHADLMKSVREANKGKKSATTEERVKSARELYIQQLAANKRAEEGGRALTEAEMKAIRDEAARIYEEVEKVEKPSKAAKATKAENKDANILAA